MKVSVEKNAVNSGISCCKLAMRELEAAANSLHNQYKRAGSSGWRDQKYNDLGVLVSRCTNALIQPIHDLEECQKKLQELLKAVENYEQVNL